MRRISLAAAFGLLSLAILAATASATTFTVSKTADTNDATCDADCSLREAIVAANADSSATSADPHLILFAASTNDTNIEITSDLTLITEEVIIRGNGKDHTTIDGNGSWNLFNTNTDSTFEDIAIVNGLTTDTSSCLFKSTGGNTTITNCKFNNGQNTAGWGASSIHIASTADKKLLITDSIISNCYAINPIYSTIPTEITNTNIEYNDSKTTGGAIFVDGASATLSITGSIFDNNDAHGKDGGAIFSNSTSASPAAISITDTTFTSNNGARGGAIFTSQTSGAFTITNSTFTSNISSSNGAAIFNSMPLVVAASEFKQNYSSSGAGGAINSSGAGATLTISDSTFQDNNTEAKSGGAIYSSSTGSPAINISNSIFQNNLGAAGGAICNEQTTGTISIANSTFSDNDGSTGGALYSNLSTTIVYSSFFNNESSASGGAIQMNATTADLTINNSTFDQNNSHNVGGAISSLCTDVPAISITESSFSNNTTSTANTGGAINSSGGLVKVTKSLFYKNDVNNFAGGAIYTKGIESYNNTYSENKGVGGGGAINNIALPCAVKNDTYYLNIGGDWTGYTLHSTVAGCTIDNSIVHADVVALQANGFYNCSDWDSGRNTINNDESLYAANRSCGDEAKGSVHNIDAKLLPLAINESVTNMTHTFNTEGAASFAIDYGNIEICNSTEVENVDQRGNYRLNEDSKCDAGAFEHLSAANTAPVGGYNSEYISEIPSSMIGDGDDGAGGDYTFTWKGYDVEDTNVVLKSFRYSIDSGSTWHTIGDVSEALSADWNSEVHDVSDDNTFASSTAHTFTFDTKHTDVNTETHDLTDTIVSTVMISFKLYDGENESDWVNSEVFIVANGSGNTAPIGGYDVTGVDQDNVIPTAQITQATDGSGTVTIKWKGKDADTDNVTLKTFKYSIDGGSTWATPTQANDGTGAFTQYWQDYNSASDGYTTVEDTGGDVFSTATAHNFEINTKHSDLSNLNGVDISIVQVQFLLNDGTADSADPVVSGNFEVDNKAPTSTITNDISYDYGTNIMTISGTNFFDIAAVDTNIETYVNWSNFKWKVINNDATNTEISFVESDVTRLTIESNTEMSLKFTDAKANDNIEATPGFGYAGGIDFLKVTAGFIKDYFGNIDSNDAFNNMIIMKWPEISVTKVSTVLSDPVNGNNGQQKRIPGAIVHYILTVTNTGTGSPSPDSVKIKDAIDSDHLAFYVPGGIDFAAGDSCLTAGAPSYSDNNGNNYEYTPAGTYDNNVTGFNIPTTGTFNIGDPTPVSFTLEYNVQIQ